MNKKQRFLIFVIAIYALIFFLVETKIIPPDLLTINSNSILSPPSLNYIMGTDQMGRSTLIRLLYGISHSFKICFFSSLLSILIGATLGIISGCVGDIWDKITIFIYTVIDSIPYMLLISSIALILGKGSFNLFLVIALTSWVGTCRLVRSEVLKIKNLDFMLSAEALGLNLKQRIFNHIIPNLKYLLLTQWGLVFIAALKAEIILSFLGLGTEPGINSIGVFIDECKSELLQGIWWNITFVSFFVIIFVLAINLLTEELK